VSTSFNVLQYSSDRYLRSTFQASPAPSVSVRRAMCARTHLHTCSFTKTHTRVTHPHTYARAHAHAHAHAHEHTHTHARTWGQAFPRGAEAAWPDVFRFEWPAAPGPAPASDPAATSAADGDGAAGGGELGGVEGGRGGNGGERGDSVPAGTGGSVGGGGGSGGGGGGDGRRPAQLRARVSRIRSDSDGEVGAAAAARWRRRGGTHGGKGRFGVCGGGAQEGRRPRFPFIRPPSASCSLLPSILLVFSPPSS
jgi:hypothetical protein